MKRMKSKYWLNSVEITLDVVVLELEWATTSAGQSRRTARDRPRQPQGIPEALNLY